MTIKKSLIASIALILLLSVVALGFTACNNNNYNIALNQTYLELEVGGEAKLTAEVTRYAGKNKPVWSSTRVEIASVSDNGVVTAISAGAATIKATLEDKTACCTILVKEAAPETVEVTSITLDKTLVTSMIGGKVQLSATVTPSNATDKVTWQSMDTSIATVTDNGLVTMVKNASTVIAAIAGDKIAVCQIIARIEDMPKVDYRTVTLNRDWLELSPNETATITATVTPTDATNKTVTWQSMNTSVATVNSDGLVTAVANGATVITAKIGSSIATCIVTVKQTTPNVDNEFRFKTLTVTNGNSVSGKVSSDTETFSFADEIVAGRDVSYTVCRDLECTDVIPSKVVRLSIGDNAFYVLANFSDNSIKLYTVTIHRRDLCTLTFDTVGGLAIEPLEVREGTTVTLPSAVKAGYVFLYWTCNGQNCGKTVVVRDDMDLLAVYEAIRYSVTLSSQSFAARLTGAGSYAKDDSVTVTTEQRLGYEFLGWFDGETKKSGKFSYTFYMPLNAVSLTAKYKMDERIANLKFVSTATTFTIKGIKEDADTSELVIPEYTTNIEENVFTSGVNIDKVTWLATDCQPVVSSTTSRDEIFYNCNIGNFYLDKSITSPAHYLFKNVTITNLHYNGTIKNWCEIDFMYAYANPLYYSENLYINGEFVEDLVIPEGVEEIKKFAFYNSGLNSVKFPKSLVSIGSYAFYNSKKLTSILWPNDGLEFICPRAFSHCEKLTGQIVLPSTLQTLDQHAFAKTNITSMVIPTSVSLMAPFDNSPDAIYYKGTADEWDSITKTHVDMELSNVSIYFYSEAEPELNDEGTDYDGFFWHYVDGEIVVWTKDDNE